MINPLEVTFRQIRSNPRLTVSNPVTTPNFLGNTILWEGRKSQRDRKSPLLRVIKNKHNKIALFKFMKMTNEWRKVADFIESRTNPNGDGYWVEVNKK